MAANLLATTSADLQALRDRVADGDACPRCQSAGDCPEWCVEQDEAA